MDQDCRTSSLLRGGAVRICISNKFLVNAGFMVMGAFVRFSSLPPLSLERGKRWVGFYCVSANCAGIQSRCLCHTEELEGEFGESSHMSGEECTAQCVPHILG